MRAALSAVLGLAMALILSASLTADDKKSEGKETTIKGTMVCAKCTLKEADKCTNAVKVKEGDKEVVYIINDKGKGESYHKGICPPNSEKQVEVTGTVSTKDGKKTITPKKGGVKVTD